VLSHMFLLMNLKCGGPYPFRAVPLLTSEEAYNINVMPTACRYSYANDRRTATGSNVLASLPTSRREDVPCAPMLCRGNISVVGGPFGLEQPQPSFLRRCSGRS